MPVRAGDGGLEQRAEVCQGVGDQRSGGEEFLGTHAERVPENQGMFSMLHLTFSRMVERERMYPRKKTCRPDVTLSNSCIFISVKFLNLSAP